MGYKKSSLAIKFYFNEQNFISYFTNVVTLIIENYSNIYENKIVDYLK